jgi:hypothetical protein
MIFMVSIVSIFFGISVLVAGSLFLWFVISRPRAWVRFTDAENEFWVRRGFPVRWAGSCKKFEQGGGMKLLVVLCLVLAAVAILLPVAHLLLLGYRH